METRTKDTGVLGDGNGLLEKTRNAFISLLKDERVILQIGSAKSDSKLRKIPTSLVYHDDFRRVISQNFPDAVFEDTKNGIKATNLHCNPDTYVELDVRESRLLHRNLEQVMNIPAGRTSSMLAEMFGLVMTAEKLRTGKLSDI